MANRLWDEPLFSRTFEGPGRTPAKEDVRDTVADAVHALDGRGRVVLPEITEDHLRDAQSLRIRYRSLNLDLADAVNVALAAAYDTDAILTLDRRDVRAVRPLGRHKAFRVLPDDLPLRPERSDP
jgi:predicted nucleic acid-binding protein